MKFSVITRKYVLVEVRNNPFYCDPNGTHVEMRERAHTETLEAIDTESAVRAIAPRFEALDDDGNKPFAVEFWSESIYEDDEYLADYENLMATYRPRANASDPYRISEDAAKIKWFAYSNTLYAYVKKNGYFGCIEGDCLMIDAVDYLTKSMTEIMHREFDYLKSEEYPLSKQGFPVLWILDALDHADKSLQVLIENNDRYCNNSWIKHERHIMFARTLDILRELEAPLTTLMEENKGGVIVP